MEVSCHRVIGGGGKTDAPVAGSFGVPDGIFRGTYMGGRGITGVLGQNGGDGGKVRASGI